MDPGAAHLASKMPRVPVLALYSLSFIDSYRHDRLSFLDRCPRLLQRRQVHRTFYIQEQAHTPLDQCINPTARNHVCNFVQTPRLLFVDANGNGSQFVLPQNLIFRACLMSPL